MESGRMEDDQQFCLRWNNHQSTLVSVFDTLLEKGMHVDCTLAAEGQTLKAHKVVLSACSPYFESVLSQQYDKHPIIILKDVKYAELRAMMDYMYRGEVNISQEQLGALLKAAESLQIKGLSDNKPPRPSTTPAVNAHPPRTNDIHNQKRDSSVDSRSGSSSPTRRRKKVRRLSSPVPPATTTPLPLPPASTTLPAAAPQAPPPAVAKEEPAGTHGVEDLTLDEEHIAAPTDVVRNFQWHMERSQEDMMNSSDTRDSQDAGSRNYATRSKQAAENSASLLTVLKPSQIKRIKSPPATPATSAPPTPSPTTPATPATSTPAAPAPGTKRASSEQHYECMTCGRRYNARRNLMRHMKLECGRDPRYKCPHCSYTKHRRNELKRHMEKKHNLPYTDKSTASPNAPAATLIVK